VRTSLDAVVWACWGAWAVLWVVMGVSTKKTAERATGGWSLALAAIVVAIVLEAGPLRGSLHDVLWAPSPLTAAIAVVLLVGGLCFTAWARVTLGRNWSGTVVVKAGHELVRSGPYRYVRHPIYTGILAMILGTAIVVAEPLGWYSFGLAVVVLWVKARREEALMARAFPGQYEEYRRQVRAIIPFVV
jgi:protein-S-isoprenylcysteine O-methyltransferase Ste14